jgi:hypothetical protein
VLEVTTSGYYAWVKRPLPPRQREEERLELEIRAAHKRTRQTYGPERLQQDLADNGIVVGFTGSIGFAGSSACGAGKNGSLRSRGTRVILRPWRKSC